MVAEKVQAVFLHSDEKWFYSLKVQQHNKLVPFLGCEPAVHPVQHKSHIGKVLVFALTAFAPKMNVFKEGGKAYKVFIARAGRKVPAQKDSYRREYRDDRTYHHPQKPENLLRSKGKLYF